MISPHKLDIGAVYCHKTKKNKQHLNFKALGRELAFDIDFMKCDTHYSYGMEVI